MRRIYQLLYPHIRHSLPWIVVSMLLSFVIAGVKTSRAYLVKPIIDSGIQSDVTFDEILWIAAVVVGLALVSFPARFFHFYWIRKVVEKATCEIRSRIYKKMQRLPLSYTEKNKQGELLSSLLNDSTVFSIGLLSFVDLVRELLTALALFGLAFYRDWQLTLAVSVVIPIFVLVFQKSGKKVRESQSKAQEQMAEMTHNMTEGLQGQKIVKAFNIQDYVIGQFEKAQRFFLGFIMKTVKAEELAHPTLEVVASVALAGVLLIAHYRISSGAMGPGDFMSFAMALVLIRDPIGKYSRANAKFNQARAAGERIMNILNLADEQDRGTKVKTSFDDRIQLNNVTFSYSEQEAVVLKDFSLTVDKGQKVALVGLSGSGKSTLISLLLRFYNIKEGHILIDNVPIQDLTLASLRSLFGFVGQDVFLFNDTIRNNVCLDGKQSEQQFQQALNVALANEIVDHLPKKLETVIGDRGTLLSGGQAQRVTIARAYLKQAPILLFDEATSALDNESEKIVQKALDNVSGQHTVIAVAHRLSTIQNFDKIVVLKQGRKVEEGSHEELISKGGEYSKLYKLSQ